jgi:hypothetical protein
LGELLTALRNTGTVFQVIGTVPRAGVQIPCGRSWNRLTEPLFPV